MSLANFDSYNVITHKNIYALCKFYQSIHDFQHGQNTWQAKDRVNITQIQQIGLGWFHISTISHYLSNENFMYFPNPIQRLQHINPSCFHILYNF